MSAESETAIGIPVRIKDAESAKEYVSMWTGKPGMVSALQGSIEVCGQVISSYRARCQLTKIPPYEAAMKILKSALETEPHAGANQ